MKHNGDETIKTDWSADETIARIMLAIHGHTGPSVVRETVGLERYDTLGERRKPLSADYIAEPIQRVAVLDRLGIEVVSKPDGSRWAINVMPKRYTVRIEYTDPETGQKETEYLERLSHITRFHRVQ